jgi:hypothetical protein
MAAVSLVIAIVALIIAVASAAYARRQAIANERAAAIEGQRRHDELTPQVTVTCKGHAGGRNADMILELTGPAGLDGLDEMTIRIRDDTTDHRPSPGSQFGQEQISDVIWGPYRFNPGLHQASSDRRSYGPFNLPASEPYSITLEQSIPPSWIRRGGWARYRNKPIRLEITCHRGGHPPWILHYKIDVEPDPESQGS